MASGKSACEIVINFGFGDFLTGSNLDHALWIFNAFQMATTLAYLSNKQPQSSIDFIDFSPLRPSGMSEGGWGAHNWLPSTKRFTNLNLDHTVISEYFNIKE